MFKGLLWVCKAIVCGEGRVRASGYLLSLPYIAVPLSLSHSVGCFETTKTVDYKFTQVDKLQTNYDLPLSINRC
jgi:hypothetical protein